MAQQILEVFWWFDAKGTGAIAHDDLARVFKDINPQWDEKQISTLIHAANSSCNGCVDYKRFINWLMGESEAGEDAAARDEEIVVNPDPAAVKQGEADAVANAIARDSSLAERATAAANELLEAALPAMEAATEALDDIGGAELAELAGLPEPPVPLADVAACVRILRPLGCAGDDEGDDWAYARALLSGAGFRRALRDYDRDSVADEQLESVRLILSQGHWSDTLAEAPGACDARGLRAGRVLHLWVLAVVKYGEVARAAMPHWRLVNELHGKIRAAEIDLQRRSEELAELRKARSEPVILEKIEYAH